MAALMRKTHFASLVNSSSVTRAKYLTALGVGLPSGLSKPLATKTGTSWGAQPSRCDASLALNCAGRCRRFRNLSRSELNGLSLGMLIRSCREIGVYFQPPIGSRQLSAYG